MPETRTLIFSRSSPSYVLRHPKKSMQASSRVGIWGHRQALRDKDSSRMENRYIYDIAPTIYLTSDTLYKLSHPQFMTLCHIIYDIACTVFMSSVPRYVTLHP